MNDEGNRGNDRPWDLPIEIFDGPSGTEYVVWTVTAMQHYASKMGFCNKTAGKLIRHLARGPALGNDSLQSLGYQPPFWPLVWILAPVPSNAMVGNVLMFADRNGMRASVDEASRWHEWIPTPQQIADGIKAFQPMAMERRDAKFIGCDGIGLREYNARLLVDDKFVFTRGMK